jgi:hypothetical protein
MFGRSQLQHQPNSALSLLPQPSLPPPVCLPLIHSFVLLVLSFSSMFLCANVAIPSCCFLCPVCSLPVRLCAVVPFMFFPPVIARLILVLIFSSPSCSSNRPTSSLSPLPPRHSGNGLADAPRDDTSQMPWWHYCLCQPCRHCCSESKWQRELCHIGTWTARSGRPGVDDRTHCSAGGRHVSSGSILCTSIPLSCSYLYNRNISHIAPLLTVLLPN